MVRYVICGLIAFAAVGYTPLHAANIYVEVSSDETVGRQLAYEIREKIAGSNRHDLVTSPDDAAFTLQIVTLDDSDGSQTVYALSLTLTNFYEPKMYQYFISSWVGRCGRDVLLSCASNVAAEIDLEIEPIARALLEALDESAGQEPEKPIF